MIGLCWFNGPLPQRVYGHDLFVLLEGGWKFRWGFVPHHDYCSVLGAVTCALVFIGMKLSGSMIVAMPAAVCLFAAITLPICIYAAFSRMQPLVAFISVVALTAACLAPHALRSQSSAFSYAEIYNKWGYCIFMIALLVVMLPTHSRAKWKEILDGLIAGAFLVASIFIKINYGLLLWGILFAFSVYFVRYRGFYVGLTIGAALLLLGCGFLVRWDFVAFIHDMRLFAHARWGLGLHGFIQALLFLWPDICLYLSLGVLACVSHFISGGSIRNTSSLSTVCVVSACETSAVLIMMSNGTVGNLRETPILTLGSLILLSAIVENCTAGPAAEDTGLSRVRSFKWPFVILGLLTFLTTAAWVRFYEGAHAEIIHNIFSLVGLLLMPAGVLLLETGNKRMGRLTIISTSVALAGLISGPVVARNINGLILAAEYKLAGKKLGNEEVFQSGSLMGLQVQGLETDSYPFVSPFVQKVQDGLDLIARTQNSGSPVASFDFCNPFNIAREVKPPAGSPLAWQLNIVFSKTSYPAVEQVFRGAEVVMIPKQFGSGVPDTLRVIDQLYGPYLRQHYKRSGESLQWFLYQRK